MESEIFKMIEARPWILLAAFVIGFVGRLVKDDIKVVPNVQSKSRVWLALFLGLVSGLAERKWGHVVSHAAPVSWLGAFLGGLASSAIAIVGHNAFIESLRGGKEFRIPWLTRIGVSPGPGKPPTIPPLPALPSIDLVDVEEGGGVPPLLKPLSPEKAEPSDEKAKAETD